MNHIGTHRVPALCVGLTAFASLLAATVAAQTFPSKTIRIVAPFPPASVADVLARPIAQKMNETWRQPVLVDNRTGAAGSVGAEVVAKAPSDGYTLLLGKGRQGERRASGLSSRTIAVGGDNRLALILGR